MWCLVATPSPSLGKLPGIGGQENKQGGSHLRNCMLPEIFPWGSGCYLSWEADEAVSKRNVVSWESLDDWEGEG